MQKVLFCGLGSMGMRHLRNLATLFQEANEPYEFHALRSAQSPLPRDVEKKIARQFYAWDESDDAYDIVFIANPTAQHYETLRQVVGLGKRIFLEKPAFHRTDLPLETLNLPEDVVCYVAAPLRYTKAIRYVKESLAGKNVLSIRCICSSFLPDWRPGSDWRKGYSANASMGGGVDLDLIHEWDYLVYLFGFPKKCYSIRGRYSNVTVDSVDHAVYIASYPHMGLSLHLDYFGRVPRRQMEIYLEDDVLLVDFIQGYVSWLKSDRCVEVCEERDEMQIEELRYFLGIESDAENENTIQHAVQVLKLAKGEWE